MEEEQEFLVTQIRPLGQKKSLISLEGGVRLPLTKKEVSRYRIEEGTVLSGDTYEEILSLLTNRAKSRVLYLLDSKDRTEQELRRKLEEGEYPSSVIDDAVAYAKDCRYVDDFRYARTYLSQYKDQKSAKRLRQDLLQRGVSADVIAEALEQEEMPEEEEALYKALEKKTAVLRPVTSADWQKTARYLIGKGFSPELVYRIVREQMREQMSEP